MERGTHGPTVPGRKGPDSPGVFQRGNRNTRCNEGIWAARGEAWVTAQAPRRSQPPASVITPGRLVFGCLSHSFTRLGSNHLATGPEGKGISRCLSIPRTERPVRAAPCLLTASAPRLGGRTSLLAALPPSPELKPLFRETKPYPPFASHVAALSLFLPLLLF